MGEFEFWIDSSGIGRVGEGKRPEESVEFVLHIEKDAPSCPSLVEFINLMPQSERGNSATGYFLSEGYLIWANIGHGNLLASFNKCKKDAQMDIPIVFKSSFQIEYYRDYELSSRIIVAIDKIETGTLDDIVLFHRIFAGVAPELRKICHFKLFGYQLEGDTKDLSWEDLTDLVKSLE